MNTSQDHVDTIGLGDRRPPRVILEAATPAEIQSRGAGLALEAGMAASPFGHCLIAETPHGICYLAFFDLDDHTAAVAGMHATWPLAKVVWNQRRAAALAARLFAEDGAVAWTVHVRGTPFQLAVWQALLRVAAGRLVSYAELAAAAGHSTAIRATGTAVGANPVAFLIPCHRVILATGESGQYRWGAARKRALIAWEKSCP